MAVSSEANRGVRLDTRRLKALTGEDPITARYLYAEYFEFLNTATIWVAVNDKPTVPDDSDGFWSRMRAIRYPVTFDSLSADPTLNETFVNDEAMGILAWVVSGAVSYYEHGVGDIPDSIQLATQAYREENDPINEFIEARCVRDPGSHVALRALYADFCSWANEQGFSEKETPARRTVHNYLKAHFPDWRDSKDRGFRGIRLRTDEPPATSTRPEESDFDRYWDLPDVDDEDAATADREEIPV